MYKKSIYQTQKKEMYSQNSYIVCRGNDMKLFGDEMLSEVHCSEKMHFI
jgi:hypothetical protein